MGGVLPICNQPATMCDDAQRAQTHRAANQHYLLAARGGHALAMGAPMSKSAHSIVGSTYAGHALLLVGSDVEKVGGCADCDAAVCGGTGGVGGVAAVGGAAVSVGEELPGSWGLVLGAAMLGREERAERSALCCAALHR
eukprot:1141608-Pelagomonas_calceolata.AAC.3